MIIESQDVPKPTIELAKVVLDAVITAWGLPSGTNILAEDHTPVICESRAAWYYLMHHYEVRYSTIGVLCNRTKKSVGCGARRCRDLMESDPVGYAEKVNAADAIVENAMPY